MEKLFDYLSQREIRHRLMTGIGVFMVVGGMIVSGIIVAALLMRH
ncbi:MAG TPA: hypothetical protein VJ752_22420 [Burkholderiaceae bacterium]|nr:hypothetical protein [Burkholderiaceae bacterium]